MSHSRNDELAYKARQTAQQTEDTLSNVQRVLREAGATATDVTNELHSQGEALRKVDGTLDAIEDETEYSKKMAKQVNKGFFSWMFTREPKPQSKPVGRTSAQEPEPQRPSQGTPPGITTSTATQNVAQSRLDTGGLRETGNNELADELDRHDERYNSQLDDIGALLDGLTVQAKEIGHSLEEQNEQISKLGNKAEVNQEKVHGVHQELKKFTRK